MSIIFVYVLIYFLIPVLDLKTVQNSKYKLLKLSDLR